MLILLISKYYNFDYCEVYLVKIIKNLLDGDVAIYKRGKYYHCRLKIQNGWICKTKDLNEAYIYRRLG